jgi:hypothetical protein
MDARKGASASRTPSREKLPVPSPKGRKKTGGRQKGTPNKLTQAFKAQRESCREIFRNAVGLEMPDDHTIDGKAVNVRKRLAKMFAGLEKPDRTYIALMQLGLAYAYGTPDKMQPEESTKKRSLVYISEGGLPWDPALDPMREQEAAAIRAQQAQEKMEAAAAERKRQGLEPDPDDDEDPDAPELVR